jgi:perosamine synthetase
VPTQPASRPVSGGLAGAAIAAIERLYRGRLQCRGNVALHEPWFRGNENAYVKECIDTGWVSSVGSYVDRFERDIAGLTGARFAIATANGTVALHVALLALGVKPGDLVVCPAVSFVATANAIAHCGAMPVFVDVDAGNLNMDAERLAQFLAEDCAGEGSDLHLRRTGQRIAAVMLAHIFGHPADAPKIAELCRARGVALLEDAAEALGSELHGRACGRFGAAGVLSFNGNKIVTTGGGGAILTDDERFARHLKHLTTTARIQHGWEFDHDEVGFNYRMPNINAALGCAQLEQLEDCLARKRRLAGVVADELASLTGIELLREPSGASSNWWLNGFFVDSAETCQEVLAATNAGEIRTRPCWRMLAELPMYRSAPRAQSGLAVAEERSRRLVSLPSSPQLMPA